MIATILIFFALVAALVSAGIYIHNRRFTTLAYYE